MFDARVHRTLSLMLNGVMNRGEKDTSPRQLRQTVFQTNLFECRQISLWPRLHRANRPNLSDGRVKRVSTQLTCESKVSLVSQSAASLVEAKWNTLYFHTVRFLSAAFRSSYMTFWFGTTVGGHPSWPCVCGFYLLVTKFVLNIQQDVIR